MTEGVVALLQAGGQRATKAQKAASSGLALINTWEGVSKALTLPWPQNFAVASRVLAQGMTAVQNIRSAGTGGGGSRGASGAAAQPSPLPVQRILIDYANGPVPAGLSHIVDQLNQAARAGYRVDVSLVGG